MIDVKTIMEQLTGQALTNSLIEFLEQHCGDFPEIHGKYQEAIARTEEGKTLAEACEIGSHLAASVIVTSENVCPRFLPEEFGLEFKTKDIE